MSDQEAMALVLGAREAAQPRIVLLSATEASILPTETTTADETQASEPTGETATSETVETMETITETINEPSPLDASKPLEPWLIVLIVVLAAAAIAAAVVTFALNRRKKLARKKRSEPGEWDLEAEGAIRIGKLHAQGKRKTQQDSFFVSPEDMVATHGLLTVVADGMGGLADGDRVSQTAVSTMAESFYNMKGEPTLLLLALLEQANTAVNKLLGPSGRNKSGSTIVAGLIKDNKFYYLSVGDSRICMFRKGALIQLNREHVFRNDLLVQTVNGEKSFHEAVSDKAGAGLTSFLGMGKLKYVDIPACPIQIRPGDRFILMSDGVYNALTDDELKACLRKHPEEAAKCIGEAIEEKGFTSQDNYTAVILGC